MAFLFKKQICQDLAPFQVSTKDPPSWGQLLFGVIWVSSMSVKPHRRRYFALVLAAILLGPFALSKEGTNRSFRLSETKIHQHYVLFSVLQDFGFRNPSKMGDFYGKAPVLKKF